MKRTFIAVRVDAGNELKEAIATLKSGLRNESIKWVDISNMHITLAFIGNTDEQAVKRVGSMIEKDFSGFGEIVFTLTGFNVFKNFNDPKVLFAGIENPGRLALANEIVKMGLDGIDIKTEDRRFSPHLTIGRIKNLRGKSNLQKIIHQFAGTPFQTVTINEIVYYESVLLQTGPVYKVISSIKLK
jgi:2'-5' RNA ligase